MSQPIAVLAAMEQEIRLIEAGLAEPKNQFSGGRRYVTGALVDVPVVVAISGFGKVAAAATVAAVLERFRPSLVLFAGVAGGVGDNVGIGDIVIAEALVQHDFDARPLFERFVIPSLDTARIPSDPDLTDRLVAAADRFLSKGGPGADSSAAIDQYDLATLTVHRGLIASGDQFIDSVDETNALRRELPGVMAVEMEGAAVAQVCSEADIPFAVFRSISDRADHTADVDFLSFVDSIAAPLTAGIVIEFLADLS